MTGLVCPRTAPEGGAPPKPDSAPGSVPTSVAISEPGSAPVPASISGPGPASLSGSCSAPGPTAAVGAARVAPRPVLYHAFAARRDVVKLVAAEDGVGTVWIDSLHEIPDAADAPAVLLLDESLARGTGYLPTILRALPESLVVVAADEEADARSRGSDRVLLALPADAGGAARGLRAAFRLSATRLMAARTEAELARARGELRDLSGVGMALMTERDPDRLLETILAKARQLTGSDAGSLYLVELGDDGEPRLRFGLAQNDTLPDVPLVSFTLPLDRASLAGCAACTGQVVAVEDAYRLPEDAPYAFNRTFDERFGYRTRSTLVAPMVDHLGSVVGVLQLINRKDDPRARIPNEAAALRHVLPYGEREVELVRSFAGQAAVSIENSLLYRQIENLFEGFVRAAVIAVDQRDPTTSGHSVRVASLTCDLAGIVAGRGAYAGVVFTREQLKELRYAALLHDFGKVGVREEVLVKPKKLPPLLLERVVGRFGLIRRTLEMEHHRARAEALERGMRPGPEAEAGLRARMAELERVRALVLAANEPSVLPEAAAAELDGVGRMTFAGPDGEPLPYLTEEELAYLRIPKGSLNGEERREIESHVEQTYRFLTQIPWTGDLKRVAEIAHAHHEKLDGTGYPRGVAADEIPLQTRILTVSDIFDALTASDRPYKRALPAERALGILHDEARAGQLDAGVVEALVESGAYRRILEVDWREL